MVHQEIGAKDVVAIIRRRFWLISLLAVFGGVAGFVAARVLPKKYLSKTLVLVQQPEMQPVAPVSVDNVNQLWVDNLRADLRQSPGFFWQNWQQAADFCAQKKINLPEGLQWAQRAVSDPTWSGGSENFSTLMTLSRLEAANGMTQEASKTFDKALNHPTADPLQIHVAGRQLLTDGNKQEAMRVFQFNARRFPNQWPVHVGLMRGYSALGDTKKALAEAKLALPQAPDNANKKSLENMIQQLEQGKDVN